MWAGAARPRTRTRSRTSPNAAPHHKTADPPPRTHPRGKGRRTPPVGSPTGGVPAFQPVEASNPSTPSAVSGAHVTTSGTPALLTVTGPDRPGVTARVSSILAAHHADLVDVEQVVINGHLTLGLLVRVDEDTDVVAVVRELTDSVHELGMQLDVQFEDIAPAAPPSTHVLLLLGSPVTASAFSAVAGTLASIGANIDTIRGIADYPVTGLELHVSTAARDAVDDARLREVLAPLSELHAVDVSVDHAGLARRSKRLVVFDVDSTLVQGEVIEMLAAHAGKEAEVRAVTERAMRGELDFAQSLHERVATLEGLPASILDEVAANIVLTPGRS